MHIAVARKIIESKKEFSCRLWKSNGDILAYNKVVATSSFFQNNTVNLLFTESRQVRKVRLVAIFELNDEEVYL
jgi:hypothetical protein